MQTLKELFKKIPILKYCIGMTAIGLTIAIFNLLDIEEATLPYVTIMGVLGFMILLYIFSSALKSNDKVIKFAGYLLVYTPLIIACSAGVILSYRSLFPIITTKSISLIGTVKGYGVRDSIGIVQEPTSKSELSIKSTFNLRLTLISDSTIPYNGVITLRIIPLNGNEFNINEFDLSKYERRNNIIAIGIIGDIDTTNGTAVLKDSLGIVKQTLKVTIIEGSAKKPSTETLPEKTVKDTLDNNPTKKKEKEEMAKDNTKKPGKDTSALIKKDTIIKNINPEPSKKDTLRNNTEDFSDLEKKMQEKAEEKKYSEYQLNAVDIPPTPRNFDYVMEEVKKIGINSLDAKVLVDENGTVTKVKVTKPSDNDRVSHKLKMLLFEAASLKGEKVKCWIRIRF